MVFTGLNDVIAAMPAIRFPLSKNTAGTTLRAELFTSSWALPGVPGAGSLSIGNTTTGAVPTVATVGAMPLPVPGAGQHVYLHSFHVFLWQLNIATIGLTLLYDRLWHAGTFSLGSSPISLTPTALTRETSGIGVEAWIECVSVDAGHTPTITLTYTNSAGTSGRTTTGHLVGVNLLEPNSMTPFQLAAGDQGIQSIQSIAVSPTTSTATINIVLMRRIGFLSGQGVTLSNPTGLDLFDTGLVQLDPNSCLQLVTQSNATTDYGVFGGYSTLVF